MLPVSETRGLEEIQLTAPRRAQRASPLETKMVRNQKVHPESPRLREAVTQLGVVLENAPDF